MEAERTHIIRDCPDFFGALDETQFDASDAGNIFALVGDVAANASFLGDIGGLVVATS